MESDLIKLYSTQILALAANIPHLGRLDAPMGTRRERSLQCGSAVTVDLDVVDGVVTRFSQDVKACALGQASASVVGANVIGRTKADIAAARDGLAKMLEGGDAPLAPFDGLTVLKAAVAFKNRHASIMLALEATLGAFEDAEAKVA